MNKINCDIIKDLIPLYVDKICSDATKQCVEEHIATCADCRRMAMLCKNGTLSYEKTDQKELDGLKKIRNKMRFQKLISYSIFILMTYLGIWLFVIHKNPPSFTGITGSCAVCMLANLFVFMGCRGKKRLGKAEYILGGISLIADVYLTGLVLHLFNKILAADSFPNPEITQLGKVVYTQLIACFCIQIAFFVYILICTIKCDKNCGLLACINIMGIFLIAKYYLCLALMETRETLVSSFVYEASGIVAIGILGMVASVLLTTCRTRKRQGAAKTGENHKVE